MKFCKFLEGEYLLRYQFIMTTVIIVVSWDKKNL